MLGHPLPSIHIIPASNGFCLEISRQQSTLPFDVDEFAGKMMSFKNRMTGEDWKNEVEEYTPPQPSKPAHEMLVFPTLEGLLAFLQKELQ